ncbi:MAG: mandelate racemase/muconate lactonizing enzyme family protein [Planctomycetaceae bacterium]
MSGARDGLFIKITTDSGIVGCGETAYVGGIKGMIDSHLANILIGRNPLEFRPLWRDLWGMNFGSGIALGGVEIALNDIRGKALGVPVTDLFGGRVRDTALTYASGLSYTEGVDPEDQFPAEAKELVGRSFKAIKMRTGRFAPRRDIKVLAAVREAVGPDIRLLTDGNGGYSFAQAVPYAKELEKLGFYYFEEPMPEAIPHYKRYPELAAAIDIPLAGGEGVDSFLSAKELIVRKSFDIIQPDATLCGGISQSIAIAEFASLFGVMTIPHCWGGAIALTAALNVVCSIPNFSWGHSSDEPMLEFGVDENPFLTELIAEPYQVIDGRVAISKKPGLGIEIDEDVIRKYSQRGVN